MSRIGWAVRWGWLGVVLGLMALSVGCSTPDADNMSARPWNAPRSWESGLPSSVYEGR